MRPGMGFWRAAAVAAVLATPATAQADDYPNKPVTFVTPAAAGNSPDVVTRLVADKLTQMWKQQVVVINRPGAGGLIAAQAAAALSDDMLQGKTPAAVNDTKTYNNGVKVVPSYLLKPVSVDASNWKEVLVTSGYYAENQIK